MIFAGSRSVATATALLARALAEQLFLGVDRDARVAQRDAGSERRDGQRDAGARSQELLPVADDLGRDVVGPQQVEQQLAPAGRFGGEQHAALGVAQLVREGVQRFLAALVDAGGRRRFGAEVHDRDGGADCAIASGRSARAGVSGAGPSRTCGNAVVASEPLVRRHADLGRIEHGVLDVVPSFLVPLDQRAPGIAQSRVVVGRQDHRGARRQVVEQRGGLLEEQRQVVLDAGRREALADVAIERHARQVALEARAEAAAEILDRLGRQAELAGRQQVEPWQLLERAL